MRITLSTLQRMSLDGNKIAMLTCYDASFAALLERPESRSCWSATRSAWCSRATTPRCR